MSTFQNVEARGNGGAGAPRPSNDQDAPDGSRAGRHTEDCMSNRFCISLVVLLTGTVSLLLPQGSMAQPGVTNCIGLAACEGNTGRVRARACHGDYACLENTGDVAKGGCIGDSACELNENAVGRSACAGGQACRHNSGPVAKGGCHGDLACRGSSASVGVDACQGQAACARSSSVSIGKESCVGTTSCMVTGANPIGKKACRGDRACFNSPGPIRDGECVGSPVGGVGVCEHRQSVGVDSNTVTLTGDNITILHVEYIDNSFVITPGQTGSAPTVAPNGSAWIITVPANRQGSTFVANSFDSVTGGDGHEWATFDFADDTPAELNFYFGVNVSLSVGGTAYTVPLFLGQGHTGFDNNWWIGGNAIIGKGTDDVAQLVVGGTTIPVGANSMSTFI